jgi:hypothetical protein
MVQVLEQREKHLNQSPEAILRKGACGCAQGISSRAGARGREEAFSSTPSRSES